MIRPTILINFKPSCDRRQVTRLGRSLALPSPLANRFLPMDQVNVESAKKYIVEFLVHGDVSVANRLADPDLCVYTGLSRSGAIRGREVYAELIHGFSTAIPVITFTIEDSYSGEEFAVVRIKGTRHFRDDLWGVKATGEIFEFLDVHFLRFRNWMIFEEVASTKNQDLEKMFAAVVLPILRAKARGFTCDKNEGLAEDSVGAH
jgi:SnoaL-like polyketide cyclase